MPNSFSKSCKYALAEAAHTLKQTTNKFKLWLSAASVRQVSSFHRIHKFGPFKYVFFNPNQITRGSYLGSPPIWFVLSLDEDSFMSLPPPLPVSYADFLWLVGCPRIVRPVALDIVFDLVMRVFGEVAPERATLSGLCAAADNLRKHSRDESIPCVLVDADAVAGRDDGTPPALYLDVLSLMALVSTPPRLTFDPPEEGLATEWLLLIRGAADGGPKNIEEVSKSASNAARNATLAKKSERKIVGVQSRVTVISTIHILSKS